MRPKMCRSLATLAMSALFSLVWATGRRRLSLCCHDHRLTTKPDRYEPYAILRNLTPIPIRTLAYSSCILIRATSISAPAPDWPSEALQRCAPTLSLTTEASSSRDTKTMLRQLRRALNSQQSPDATSLVSVKFLIFGHSMGAPMMAYYENVAEHGAGACTGPERLLLALRRT